MTSLISAELLKLRTTRALWVAAAVVLTITVVLPFFYLMAVESGDAPAMAPSVLTELLRAPAQLAGGAALLVGLLASAGEFRHGTMLTTRLTEPRPTRIFAAKLVALAGVGLLLGVVVEIVAGVVGAVVLGVNEVAVEPWAYGAPRVAITVPVLLALHAMLGVAIGALLRSTAAAVGATLVWVFVVEGIIPVVSRSPGIVHWLPGGTVHDILATQATAGQPGPVSAGALLLGYVVAFVAAAAVLDRSRDV